jgi:spermidine/putrescine transport system permease protein
MVFPIHVSLERLDRRLLEASMDLYATPWATFRQATLPQLLPAIAASFLLAFAFSFNDFVIVFFVAGPNTTLPISILASIRRGVTPERRRQRA